MYRYPYRIYISKPESCNRRIRLCKQQRIHARFSYVPVFDSSTFSVGFYGKGFRTTPGILVHERLSTRAFKYLNIITFSIALNIHSTTLQPETKRKPGRTVEKHSTNLVVRFDAAAFRLRETLNREIIATTRARRNYFRFARQKPADPTAWESIGAQRGSNFFELIVRSR